MVDGRARILVETNMLQASQIPGVEEIKRAGHIFSVDHNGTEYFPAYQFDADGKPLPIIQEIIASFGAGTNAWHIAGWIQFPNGYLEAWCLKDCLNDREAILYALQNRVGTYIA